MKSPCFAPAASSVAAHNQFIVSHGKGGALGVFTSATPLRLQRGDRVILRTQRGIEAGTVLCPANARQADLLGTSAMGELTRPWTQGDDVRQYDLAEIERRLFEAARRIVLDNGLELEILDVEVLFDGAIAIVHFVGDDAGVESFAQALENQFGLSVRVENLAIAVAAEEESHGCDKPDCGRTADGGGGCTTCSTGGGCGTCGSSKVDIRQYFGHLRTKMETRQRIPLT